MPKAIRIHQIGGPEALAFDEVELNPPAPDEVQIEQRLRDVGATVIGTGAPEPVSPLTLSRLGSLHAR